MKYYFSKESEEHCYAIDYFEVGQVVYEAKAVRNIDMFHCAAIYEVGEKGYCGKQCKKYKPRNNKNGICLYNRPVYEKTNNKIIIT